MFEWYMAKACSENGHKNDMCVEASSHVVNVDTSKSHTTNLKVNLAQTGFHTILLSPI